MAAVITAGGSHREDRDHGPETLDIEPLKPPSLHPTPYIRVHREQETQDGVPQLLLLSQLGQDVEEAHGQEQDEDRLQDGGSDSGHAHPYGVVCVGLAQHGL
jgi:hypothetical protein